MYMHIWMHILKYISAICSVHSSDLYVCFQGWSFSIAQPIGLLFPGEGYFSCFYHPLVASSSLCRVELWRTLSTTSVLFLFSSCVGRHVVKTLRVKFLAFLGDTISQWTYWSSGSASLSMSSCTMFLEPWVWEYFVDITTMNELHNSAF